MFSLYSLSSLYSIPFRFGGCMTERQLVAQFNKDIEAAYNFDFEVLPDTGTKGHKKPYDAFCCYDGLFFAFEFKKFDNDLEPHQRLALQKVSANLGYAFKAEFSKDEKSLTLYNVAASGACVSLFPGWHKVSGKWFTSFESVLEFFGHLIVNAEHENE